MNKLILNKIALINNINIIKKQLHQNTKFCAVVKANAYGHNLKKIISIINNHVDYYAVAHLSEALVIRKYDKTKNILILGKLDENEIKIAIQKEIEFSISSFLEIKKTYEIARKIKKIAKVHIKLNTGMNRLGISSCRELEQVENFILSYKNINIKGVFTHFATPNSNKKYFDLQINKWNYLLSKLKNKYLTHCSSSSAYIYDKKLMCNMVRIGISMYGFDQTNNMQFLSPCLSLTSKIEQINCLNRGDFCGYDANFVADSRTKIAVIGIGYGDGIMRAIAKNGYVIINDCRCKIVGKVCMDMMFCDVTNCSCQVGDEVIIIGNSKNQSITAKDIANWCGTIEYEILTNLSLVRK